MWLRRPCRAAIPHIFRSSIAKVTSFPLSRATTILLDRILRCWAWDSCFTIAEASFPSIASHPMHSPAASVLSTPSFPPSWRTGRPTYRLRHHGRHESAAGPRAICLQCGRLPHEHPGRDGGGAFHGKQEAGVQYPHRVTGSCGVAGKAWDAWVTYWRCGRSTLPRWAGDRPCSTTAPRTSIMERRSRARTARLSRKRPDGRSRNHNRSKRLRGFPDDIPSPCGLSIGRGKSKLRAGYRCCTSPLDH